MSNDANGNLVLFGGLGFATDPPSSTTTTTAPAQGPSTSATTGASGTTSSAPAGSAPQAALTTANATTLDDTWRWTSNGWTPDPVRGPSPRQGAAMALDATTKEVILTAGDASAGGPTAGALLGDTWAWNGTSWSKVAPHSAPPARSGALLTADPLIGGGGLVLFGGSGTHGILGDTWWWNGTSWSAVRTGGTQPVRTEAAAAFDSGRHELVVFGGTGTGGVTLGDTQVLSGQAPLVLGTGRVTASSSNRGTSSTTPSPASRGHHAAVIPAPSSAPSIARTTLGPSSSGSSGQSSLHFTTHRLHRGDLVTLTGTGFAAHAPITVTFHSTPTFVGHTTAGDHGQFSVTVPVPESAAGGLHHFVATGQTVAGQQAEVVTAVEIVGVPLSTPTRLQTVVMVGLALLLPAGTWCALAAAGWWRRRRPIGV